MLSQREIGLPHLYMPSTHLTGLLWRGNSLKIISELLEVIQIYWGSFTRLISGISEISGLPQRENSFIIISEILEVIQTYWGSFKRLISGISEREAYVQDFRSLYYFLYEMNPFTRLFWSDNIFQVQWAFLLVFTHERHFICFPQTYDLFKMP